MDQRTECRDKQLGGKAACKDGVFAIAFFDGSWVI
jgi:hypothetical protein